MLTPILIIVAVAVVVLLGYAATRPDTFHIARTASIRAPAERIQPLIADLHAHERWSPFLLKDPSMSKAYSGAPQGVGATLVFDGNREVGKGRISVTGDTPREVTMRLQMFKPMPADHVVQFRLEPRAPDATDVTWSLSGRQPFFGKLMCLVVNMDEMVGKEFSTGLASLKNLAEAR